MSGGGLKRRVSVFGATGSVGQNTVDLIAARPQEFDVVALSGGRNIARLAEQAIGLHAEVAITAERDLLTDLQDALTGTGIRATAGRMALLDAAELPVDWAMSAIVGFAGLEVSLAAARHGGVLALANKESLVCAGPVLHQTCDFCNTTLVPVDSEHSAIFQALGGEDRDAIERIILTASGGPFLRHSLDQMARATPEQAAAHPKWCMGKRISIDSASMFNKAMEMIETKELFGVDAQVIEVIIHPQSVVHCIVGFNDGALMAHMGPQDMRGPIGFALNWPHRSDLPLERLDFGALGRLDFEHPDGAQFPAISLARDVMAHGGLAGAVFNGAKERCLDLFVERRIGFADMARLVGVALERFARQPDRQDVTMDGVVWANDWSRAQVDEAAQRS
jgi:1-deoxy-D-xylulose-5-phosphate reductoisomerase